MIHVLNQVIIGAALISVMIVILVIITPDATPKKRKNVFMENTPQSIWLLHTLEEARETGEFYRVFLQSSFWDTIHNRELFYMLVPKNFILSDTTQNTLTIIFSDGRCRNYDY